MTSPRVPSSRHFSLLCSIHRRIIFEGNFFNVVSLAGFTTMPEFIFLKNTLERSVVTISFQASTMVSKCVREILNNNKFIFALSGEF